jgi:hypothetical protein
MQLRNVVILDAQRFGDREGRSSVAVSRRGGTIWRSVSTSACDFVIGFEREDDARRVMSVLGKRFERETAPG